jgi:hypothetical protein
MSTGNGECSSGGRSRAMDDTDDMLATDESAMPATPTGNTVPLPLSTASTAAKSTEGGWSFAGVSFRAGLSDEEEEEEESDEEGERDKEGELAGRIRVRVLSPTLARRSTATTPPNENCNCNCKRKRKRER